MRLLIADDDPGLCRLIDRALTRAGHAVTSVTDGRQAIAALATATFDAIISDMGRPPDSRAGYTLLEAVRGSGDRTPYFIYAGSRDPAHVREARSRGAQGSTNMGDELLQMLLQELNV